MHDGSLRTLLRDRTRELHHQLDTTLAGPDGRVGDVAGYVRVLTVLHALHRHADAALRHWAGTSPTADGLDAASLPDRAPAYAADLARLGRPPRTVRTAGAAPVSDGRGLALLYLVAGSAAGARVLLRGLPASVPAAARTGLTDAAAPRSTTLWRDTCSLLSRPTEPALQQAAVTEASAVMAMLLDGHEQVAS